jgi:hypothetical protein
VNKLPNYVTQLGFEQTHINQFLSTGKLSNEFDSYGNLIMKSVIDEIGVSPELGHHLIAIETNKRVYNPAKLKNFIDTEFSEFTDATTLQSSDTEPQHSETIETDVVNQITRENVLQTQLDELSDILDQEKNRGIKEQEDAETNFKASKSVIVQLRIAAGEGNTEADFSDAFPFAPLTPAQLAANQTGIETSPFMRVPQEDGS